MPLPDEERTISLEPVGSPEFEVTLRSCLGIPYGEFRDIFVDHDYKEEGEDRGFIQHVFSKLVARWNLTDRNGQSIPIPSQDPEVIFKIPNSFAQFISDEIFKDSQEVQQRGLNLAQRKGIN